jgi:hypothetical protein
MPLRHEGVGLVMLEALHYGLPVAASAIDGMLEMPPPNGCSPPETPPPWRTGWPGSDPEPRPHGKAARPCLPASIPRSFCVRSAKRFPESTTRRGPLPSRSASAFGVLKEFGECTKGFSTLPGPEPLSPPGHQPIIHAGARP